MHWLDRHIDAPDATFDAGGLDCGKGLLLLIRQHLDPLDRGQILEVLSTEPSVEEDLPGWCRLTGNALVSLAHHEGVNTPPIPKPRGRLSDPGLANGTLPLPAEAPPVAGLSVMGIGSWPRPRWMRRAIHGYVEQRIGEDEFREAGDDAVRLA